MILSKSDFPHIKWSAIFFLLAFGSGSAMLIFSKTCTNHAQQEQKAAQHRLNEARHQLSDAYNRMTAAQDDQKNKDAYAQEYAGLLDRKIIGGDQRLDWIEGLDTIRKQNRVLDFKYTIAPQQPYTPPMPVENGNYDLNLSTMTLHLDLLHEEQLINFFEALRTEMKGRFILDSCALDRSGATPENIAAPQLKAECVGGWLTLQNRNAK